MNILIFSLALLALSPAAAQNDMNMYVEGGIQRDIYGPSDKTSRRISLRLYCDKDSNGYVYNQLGIYDVTDMHDIYGQLFSIAGDFPHRNGTTFMLDDRTPGHRLYTLTITPTGPNTNIKFGRPGNADQITTTKDKLLAVRARYAFENGTRVYLGSREFLVIKQLGVLPGLVFFHGDLERRLAAGDTNAAYATFFVKTMRRRDGGGWVNERGPLLIGEVDGQTYELALNPQTNEWVIQQR